MTTKPKTPSTDRWQLRLYVAGQTPKSITALANLKQTLRDALAGRYEIEVIDLLKNPKLAAGDQILAIPTLVRKTAHAHQEDHRRPFQRNSRAGRPRPATRLKIATCDPPLDTLILMSTKHITKRTTAQAALEKAAAAKPAERYVLRLYIAGLTPRSTLAIQNIRKICEEHLEGRYDLQVVDIYQQPGAGRGRADHRRPDAGQETAAAPAPVHRRHEQHRPHPRRHGLADGRGEARGGGAGSQVAMTPPPQNEAERLAGKRRAARPAGGGRGNPARHPLRRGGRAGDGRGGLYPQRRRDPLPRPHRADVRRRRHAGGRRHRALRQPPLAAMLGSPLPRPHRLLPAPLGSARRPAGFRRAVGRGQARPQHGRIHPSAPGWLRAPGPALLQRGVRAGHPPHLRRRHRPDRAQARRGGAAAGA